ncbi:MAG: M3 family oligoendopeptidase [Rhodospirillaceae bacterium]|nr:M3 family oligoendopeptidase [Rhodospirillaceae bacterium]
MPTAPQPKLENLPRWNLADLYASPQDPVLENDLALADRLAGDFQTAYQNNLAQLDAKKFGRAINDYEAISELLQKAISYGQLLFTVNMDDGDITRFYQTLQERITDISTKTLFFTLEINRLSDEEVEGMLAGDEGASRYRPWINEVRLFKNHQLSDELEMYIHEKSVSGKAAWVRLFEETFSEMRFDVDGDKLTQSDVLNLLSDKDGAKRKSAALAFGKTLSENIRLLALITNTLAKEKEIDDRWRKYARPVSSRNLANQVEDEVVDALVSSVSSSYENLSHRYYKLKAKWFGRDTLDYWDRNAPLPFDDAQLFSWDDARDTVLSAYEAFSPKIAKIASRFFENNWIDAAPDEGKDAGAYSHPVVPSAHPYILMNFHGKSRDVMTLAHELGHGVHQVLAAKQGTLMSDTPLTTAETASVFGEMLTFRSMVNGETDDLKKRVLLAGKVEDMLNTVVRQVAFHDFETVVHAERKTGELSPERLSEIWIDIQSSSLGPAIKLDSSYGNFWSYIPHFVHTPFYVYAYAFGDCLVNSLYDVYLASPDGFQEKYIEMLIAGGTRRHGELLAPFGLDAANPDFWQRGLSVVSGFIDQLEAMEAGAD